MMNFYEKLIGGTLALWGRKCLGEGTRKEN